MQRIITTLLLIALMACSATEQTTEQIKWKPAYRLQIGANKGGITENTDMTVISNTSADAYSGATKTGFNVGARTILPLKKNSIETGIDFMYNNQTFTYSDVNNGFDGTRKIGTSQIMMPITYSVSLFRRNRPQGLLQIKLGYLAQLNFFNFSDNGSQLPNYSTKAFSNGLIIGLSSTPLNFRNGTKLGFFLEGYRGTSVYQDFYNKSEYEMPGTSFLKYGIIIEF